MGMGMGMMNVPPEKVAQLNVTTVCLEHGKREPRSTVPYEIEPLDNLTTVPGVRELCQMLGGGQIDQRAAQAAAWHLNNGMSWETLAAKQIVHANGTREPYFTPAQLQAGMQIATTAKNVAESRKQQNAGSSTFDQQPSEPVDFAAALSVIRRRLLQPATEEFPLRGHRRVVARGQFGAQRRNS